jgi:hypothetical protein
VTAARLPDPYDNPEDFVWLPDSGRHTAKIALRKPAGWKLDPLFDEAKYAEEYREAMIRDSQWVGGAA